MSQTLLTQSDTSLPVAAQAETSVSPSTASCSTGSCPIHRAMWGMTAAIIILGSLTLGYLIWLTNHYSTATKWQLPATINASAAVSSDKFSIATGAVGDEAEGLFVLDHNSGLLQCSVMYPRLGKFMALYKANVGDALGAGAKGSSYIMVTGAVDFPRSNANPIASTLVYVMNTTTGNFAAYAIPFDRTLVNSGQPQTGILVPMGTGQANPVIDRDALR